MADDNAPPIDWEGLTSPLDPSDIEWLPKGKAYQKNGRSFKACVPYLKMQSLRRRLDKYALGVWSYDVYDLPFSEGQPLPRDTRGELDGEPFYCKGTITINGGDRFVARSAIGAGKNYKEAETDAFKRAGQRLGIGNELYGELEVLEVEVDQYGQPIDAKGAYLKKVDPDSYDMVAHETPLVDPRKAVAGHPQAVPKPQPEAGTIEAQCPACNGKMFDNRFSKKNPKAPDFKCRDRSCDGVWWKLADYEKFVAERDMAEMPIKDRLDLDDDELPF